MHFFSFWTNTLQQTQQKTTLSNVFIRGYKLTFGFYKVASRSSEFFSNFLIKQGKKNFQSFNNVSSEVFGEKFRKTRFDTQKLSIVFG